MTAPSKTLPSVRSFAPADDVVRWYENPFLRIVLRNWRGSLETNYLDLNAVASEFRVSAATVEKWLVKALPAKRIPELASHVRPSPLVYRQEADQLEIAREAVETLKLRGAKTRLWHERGWTSPHVVHVVKFPLTDLWIPRITSLAEAGKARVRAGVGIVSSGTVIATSVYDSYFEAQVGRFELLARFDEWRVAAPLIPTDRELKKLQGHTCAVLPARTNHVVTNS